MFVLVNASTTPQKNINNDNENVWNDKNEEKDEDSEKIEMIIFDGRSLANISTTRLSARQVCPVVNKDNHDR